jgi:hypothetical protein
MNPEIFRNISRIIERDSKVSTYKFALLRGTIDVIQENSPYIKVIDGRVHMPLGLLIEKWLIYYFPLLESSVTIPQNYGAANLAFEIPFKQLIDFYQNHNRLSGFYNDLRCKGIPEEILPVFRELVTKLKGTIVRMPMCYIGQSVYGSHYSVYRSEGGAKAFPKSALDRNTIIERSGWFSIPTEYFEVFKLIGSFVGGQDSILFKWAEFSVRADQGLAIETVLDRILQSPVTERDSNQSKELYDRILEQQGAVRCVWTGRHITNFHVDHVIPFAIWKNNDLWNLLPSTPAVNSNKLDKIPSPEMIESSGERIIAYWHTIAAAQSDRFLREIQVSLLGEHSSMDWEAHALHQLQDRCAYLIDSRGFQAWSI